MDYRDHLAAAQAADVMLRADNERFNHCVSLAHEDGSFFLLDGAFFDEVDGAWYYVFTEHHGVFVFPKEDVLLIKEYSHI